MTESKSSATEIGSLFRSADGVPQTFDMPFADRQGEVRVVSNNNIVIIDSLTLTDHQTSSWQHINDRPFLELNFMLEGSMYQSQGSLLKKQRFDKGYYNIVFNPGTAEQSQFIGTGRFRNVGIHIHPDRAKTMFTADIPELSYLAEKIEAGKPFMYQTEVAGMNSQMKYFFDTLWLHSESLGLATLHFEAYNMELLSLTCSSLIKQEKRNSHAHITKADVDKLYHAREILLSNLSDPPLIHQLSAICGLNEFKLKKGFKQLFDRSILGFVNENRLQSAKTAIYLGEKTISEIAYELGFSHPQHFHRAFKKRFWPDSEKPNQKLRFEYYYTSLKSKLPSIPKT